MKPAKLARESEVVSRRLVMPPDINPNGTLFGGVLMSWIDIAAFMCAQHHAESTHVVTASIDRLDFLIPLRVGDHVVISASLEHVGKSSMAIRVAVEKEMTSSRSRVLVAETYLTFVAKDASGQPTAVPPLAPGDSSEQLRQSEAALRSRLIRRFRSWWQRRQKVEGPVRIALAPSLNSR